MYGVLFDTFKCAFKSWRNVIVLTLGMEHMIKIYLMPY